MRVRAALALSIAAIAGPANATPPTVISMEDQPFGLSDTEFFALRTTTDNLGSHFESRHETFLVATNLETREQVMWHVDSVQITTIFGDRGDDDRRAMMREDGMEFADPLAVLRERGGVPWRAVSSGEHWRGGPSVLETMGTVSLSYGKGPFFLLPKEAAIGFALNASNLMAVSVPDYSRLESISTREQFTLRRFVSAGCKYAPADFARSPLGFEPVQLVEVTCSDEEELDGNTLLVPVLPQAQAE